MAFLKGVGSLIAATLVVGLFVVTLIIGSIFGSILLIIGAIAILGWLIYEMARKEE